MLHFNVDFIRAYGSQEAVAAGGQSDPTEDEDEGDDDDEEDKIDVG